MKLSVTGTGILALALMVPAAAQTYTEILRAGDPLPGGTGELVTRVDNVDIMFVTPPRNIGNMYCATNPNSTGRPALLAALGACFIHEREPPVRPNGAVARKIREWSGGGPVGPLSIHERTREAGGGRRPTSDAATALFGRAGGFIS